MLIVHSRVKLVSRVKIIALLYIILQNINMRSMQKALRKVPSLKTTKNVR